MKQIKNSDMLNAFLRDTFDIIQSVKPNGQFELTNPAWHTAFGYSEEELNTITLFNLIHPDSLDHCMDIFKRVIGSKERVSNFTAKFVTKQGEIVEIEGTATPYVVNNEVVSTFTMLRDVTVQNQIKRDLLQQNEQLREIARIQSHQVRGPLASVLGLLKLIEVEGITNKEVLDNLKDCSTKLDDAIKQIVETSNNK